MHYCWHVDYFWRRKRRRGLGTNRGAQRGRPWGVHNFWLKLSGGGAETDRRWCAVVSVACWVCHLVYCLHAREIYVGACVYVCICVCLWKLIGDDVLWFLSCHIIRHTMSCHIIIHTMSCHIIRHTMSCHIIIHTMEIDRRWCSLVSVAAWLYQIHVRARVYVCICVCHHWQEMMFCGFCLLGYIKYMCTHVCLYAYVCACVYVCICVRMCVCMHMCVSMVIDRSWWSVASVCLAI